MKNLCFFLLFLISVSAYSQDSTDIKINAPKIVSKLMYGKTININNLGFKFVSIESDSRCPKGVQCVWAGEAIALIDVFENGEKIDTKRIVFSFKNKQHSKIGNVFSSENLDISAFNIAPYPQYQTKIKPEDYYIQLDVRD